MSSKAIYFGLAVFIVLYLYAQSSGFDLDSIGIPSEAKIQQVKDEISEMQGSRVSYLETHYEEQKDRYELKAMTAGFWLEEERIPTNKIQKALDQTARNAGIDLGRLGNPKVSELSPNVQIVEIDVTINKTNIEKLAKFVHFLDAHDDPGALYWSSCTIRPVDLKNPVEITVRGEIRALVLRKLAQEYVNENVIPGSDEAVESESGEGDI